MGVKTMAYHLSSFDVCVPGFERLRSYHEFMLVIFVSADSTPDEIKSGLESDLQSHGRPDHFDYDEALRVINEFVAGLDSSNPFNLETQIVGEDDVDSYGDTNPNLYLYIRDLNNENTFGIFD
jgi:hypothetical protein